MEKIKTYLERLRNSKYLLIAIVWTTLLLDFLLFSCIVPIIPKIIQDDNLLGFQNNVPLKENATGNQSSVLLKQIETQQVSAENRLVGIFLAIKQIVQIIVNFISGPLVDRIGFDAPLYAGYVIIIISSSAFAVAQSYSVLLAARALQGVGSSFVCTCCMALLATRFQDDVERGQVFGYALCGISVGLLVGPTFGAVLYDLGKRPAPFVTLAAIAALMICIRLIIKIPTVENRNRSAGKATYLVIKLLTDPYILLTVTVIVLGNIGIGFLQGTLPLRMLRIMHPQEWMLGVVFLPMDGGYVIGVIIYSYVVKRIGLWYTTFYPRFIVAGCICAYPFCKTFGQLVAPAPFIGFCTCFMNATMYRAVATFVDKRIKNAVYGTVYALANTAFALAYGLGPLLGGLLVPAVGFEGTMFIAAGTTLATTIPIGLLYNTLRDQPKTEEKEETPLITEEHSASNYRNGEIIRAEHVGE